MVMSKTQTALAFALVVSTASLVWQYQANSRLKHQLAAVRTTNLTPASPAVVEDPLPVVSKPEVVTNVVVEPFDWRKVESSDYREYVANLRAIGCPPATIQDIVSADLRKNLQDKLKLPAEKPVRPYWLDDERAAQAAMNEAYAQRQELLNQFSATHQQLLGVPPDHATLKTFMNSVLEEGMVDSRNALMANWPAELKEKVSAIEGAHSERVRENGTINTTGFETSMERMALELQRENALAEVLTPGKFTEYLLRESVTARMMRHRLRHFGPTEEEFRKIFPLRRGFDAQWGPYDNRPTDPVLSRQYDAAREELVAQIQQVLGNERFEALAAHDRSSY